MKNKIYIVTIVLCLLLLVGCSYDSNRTYKNIFKKYPDSTIYTTTTLNYYFVVENNGIVHFVIGYTGTADFDDYILDFEKGNKVIQNKLSSNKENNEK